MGLFQSRLNCTRLEIAEEADKRAMVRQFWEQVLKVGGTCLKWRGGWAPGGKIQASFSSHFINDTLMSHLRYNYHWFVWPWLVVLARGTSWGVLLSEAPQWCDQVSSKRPCWCYKHPYSRVLARGGRFVQDQGAQLVGSCCLVTGSTSEVTYLIFGNHNLLSFSLNTIVFVCQGYRPKSWSSNQSSLSFRQIRRWDASFFILIIVIATNCIFTIRVLRLMGQSWSGLSCIWCLWGECWNQKSRTGFFILWKRRGIRVSFSINLA